MNDEAAFLAMISANPDEDTHRLVYADWLDEQGGERNTSLARLIRWQIATGAVLTATKQSERK